MSEMSEAIRKAVSALKEQRPYQPCQHIVHPRYGDMERVYADPLPTDHVTGCAALCGAVLIFRDLTTLTEGGNPR